MYIVEQAGHIALYLREGNDVRLLPSMLKAEWCGNTEDEIWSLNSAISAHYNSFSEELRPEYIERIYGE